MSSTIQLIQYHAAGLSVLEEIKNKKLNIQSRLKGNLLHKILNKFKLKFKNITFIEEEA